MRDPCWVVGIDRPRHANEPAHVARVTYRHDSYGFASGTHVRSLLAGTQAGKRCDATGITTHSFFRSAKFTTSISSKFFSCNIFFIFIQVNLATINSSNVPILGGDAGNIETDASLIPLSGHKRFTSDIFALIRHTMSRSIDSSTEPFV